ncbi:MAG: potassium-transporting ATPase subunit KdpA, partial [Chlorobiales bacterium]|nr:potassium-transporting ATPase subunit KdpA [Chlorobiales bacterium]
MSEIFGIGFIYLLTVSLAIPIGGYMARVIKGEKTFLDFLAPLENALFKLAGIQSNVSMTWKEYLKALLTSNLIWFVWATVVLISQSRHPFWNPDVIGPMSPSQAFNTAV